MTGSVAIRGIGAVGGFGAGVEALAGALAAGTGNAQTVAHPAEGGMLERRAFLADTARIEEFVDKKPLRRLDHLSKLAVLGAALALRDAGLAEAGRETGVVVATGYGAARTTFAFLDSVMRDGDPLSSPTLFSSSVHNAPAAHLAIILGAAGPSLTVSQFELSFPSALLTACRWILEGRTECVLCGGLDEYCDVLGYCWHRFLGPDDGGPCRPLDLDRQSAIPGEGACFFLLTRDEGAAPAYGRIEEVSLGRGGSRPPLATEALLVLGADGHRRCARGYRELVQPGAQVAAFAPMWGSLPAGPAFDLAAAALIAHSGKVPAQPGGPGEGHPWRAAEEELGHRPVTVLKARPGGDWGLVTIRKP